MPPRSSALIHAGRGGFLAWRAAAAQLLQTHHELSFPQVSSLLDLKAAGCIYDENTRPETSYGA